MKKSTAGFALAATVGFSAMSAAPAMAVTLPFENCDAAEAVGVYNIPEGTPGYGSHLDRDNDGFGCDAAGTPSYDASIVDRIVVENASATTETPTTPTEPTQMEEVPVGGADTGVAQEPANNNTGALALGGGLVLAAAAGGTYLVRRRHGDHA